MSAITKSTPVGWPAAAAFTIGALLIASASILNVVHDRVPELRPESLPVVGPLYAAYGKLGITALLVSLGLLALLTGFGLRRNRPFPVSDVLGRAPSAADSRPYFYTARSTEPSTTSGGRVVLETWKYVTPPNGTPGTT